MTKIKLITLSLVALIVGSCGAVKNDFEFKASSSDFAVYNFKGKSCKNQINPPSSGDPNDLEPLVMPVGRVYLSWPSDYSLTLQNMEFRFNYRDPKSGKNTTQSVNINGSELGLLWTGSESVVVIPARKGEQQSSVKCSLMLSVPGLAKDQSTSGYGEINITGSIDKGGGSFEAVFSTSYFNWTYEAR